MAVLLRWQRAPPSPRGPQSRRWGGRLTGTCRPAHVGTAERIGHGQDGLRADADVR